MVCKLDMNIVRGLIILIHRYLDKKTAFMHKGILISKSISKWELFEINWTPKVAHNSSLTSYV
jgi:hypothetical protein